MAGGNGKTRKATPKKKKSSVFITKAKAPAKKAAAKKTAAKTTKKPAKKRYA